MYVVPIVILVVLAILALAWSPVFAVILALIAFGVFFATVGLRPRADQEIDPPTGSAEKYEDDTPKGAWGEPRS